MLCRRHILRAFSSRPQPLLRARQVSRISARPAYYATCNPLIPLTPRVPHRSTRRYASAAIQRLAQEGMEIPIEPSEYRQILARAKKVWPRPPSVPDTWSCTWEEWAYLLTFYWLSPYYLMLPQIEMLVNIRHRIPGETRPILFSNERQAFVFTLVNSPKEFFLFDGGTSILYRVQGVRNEHTLVQLMDKGDEALEAKLQVVPPNEEGEDALKRILERDETVIPLLADKFLDYTPLPTTPWEEGIAPEDENFLEADFMEEIDGLYEEAQNVEKAQKLQAMEDGVDSRSEEIWEEEEDDDDLDPDEKHPLEEALDNIDNMEDVEELLKLAREEEEARKTTRSTH
ncbi:hypothetical protein FPV67DRAFT_1483131 [Lyophyllum atratum]|nr:hypothetical protein FPV67DRAFT_1483131 [Lyophyllum atratum]